jgi:hypothetical protein
MARKPRVHTGGQGRLARSAATPAAITETDPMTRYRISQGGEPVAIVTSLDLAQGIARGQARGYFSVDELQVDPLVAAGEAAVRRRAIRHRTGRKPGTQSDRNIEQ